MTSEVKFIPEANGVVQGHLNKMGVRAKNIDSGKGPKSSAFNNKPAKPITTVCVTPKKVGLDFRPPLKFEKDELRGKLTPMQYHVTQEKGTERENSGEFVRFSQNGTYACIVCGEEIFSSMHKFFSGSGWPSFKDVINKAKVVLKPDSAPCGSVCGGGLVALPSVKSAVITSKYEVVCSTCGSHIGHLFEDGPKPTGLRYCVNSIALNFIKQVPRETEV